MEEKDLILPTGFGIVSNLFYLNLYSFQL